MKLTKARTSSQHARINYNNLGKIANNNRFTDLAELLDMAGITSGCNVQSYETTRYRNRSQQTKAWHANTKDKEQISLTELIPKINKKDGSTHENMANDMTDSDMAATTESRHVGELVQLTTEQYMAWQGNQQ